MIHAIDEFCEIGEADPKRPKLGIILEPKLARRQAGRMQRAPEFVLGMGIIGLLQRRLPPRRRAAENQLQSRYQPLGQDMLFVVHLKKICGPVPAINAGTPTTGLTANTDRCASPTPRTAPPE